MSIWLVLLLVVVGLLIAARVLLSITVFVTHLVEVRPVRTLILAPADDPEHAKLAPGSAAAALESEDEFNPYASPRTVDYAAEQNRAVRTRGFQPHGLCVGAKRVTRRLYGSLWTAPEHDVLAVVMWGTIAGINASKTILYTRKDDGRYLVTADKLTGTDTPGFYELAVVLNAPFDLLLRRHRERLATSGHEALPFDGPDALSDYFTIIGRRYQFLVDTGDAYYIDADHTAIRSTLKGALKGWARSWRVPRYVEKIVATASGPDTTEPLQRPTPAPLVWAEWVFLFILIFSYLWDTQGVRTPRQLALRQGIFGVALVGLPVIWVLKAIFKRKPARAS